MDIYFSGSIRAGRADANLYHEIISILKSYGHVLTEHIGESVMTNESHMNDAQIFEQDVAWLRKSDIVVAEVTNPSLGVGYELGVAESIKVPVICVYRSTGEKRLSAMVKGNPYFKVFEYSTLNDLEALFALELCEALYSSR